MAQPPSFNDFNTLLFDGLNSNNESKKWLGKEMKKKDGSEYAKYFDAIGRFSEDYKDTTKRTQMLEESRKYYNDTWLVEYYPRKSPTPPPPTPPPPTPSPPSTPPPPKRSRGFRAKSTRSESEKIQLLHEHIGVY